MSEIAKRRALLAGAMMAGFPIEKIMDRPVEEIVTKAKEQPEQPKPIHKQLTPQAQRLQDYINSGPSSKYGYKAARVQIYSKYAPHSGKKQQAKEKRRAMNRNGS